MILLEIGSMDGLFTMFVLFWAIPIIMLIIGLVMVLSKKNIKVGKVLLILSGVWLVVGLGACGMILGGV